MMNEKVPSRFSGVLLEIADDLRLTGIMDEEAYRKITLRHLGGKAAVMDEPLRDEEIG